jgi:predicted dehydrogenase
MSESGLKCAVVGLGLGRHFLAALASNKKVDRIAICDPDPAKVDEFREEPGIAESYPELGRMLQAEQPDLVCLVTPDHLHRPHAEACFAAGTNVLQTKPLATNLEDARAIVSAAESAGHKLMVAHERRFRPSVRVIKSIVDAGEIGDLIHLRIDAIQDKRGQFERSPWYASAESGRSALNGTGIHEVDLTRHLIDRPLRSVSAFANRLGQLDFPKDKTTAAIFDFEDDIVGQVTVTYEGRWPSGKAIDDHLRILGTKGSIFGNKVYREGQDDWEEIEVERNEIVLGIKGCVDAFVDSVANDAPIPITGEDAFTTLAAACAADLSAATGVTQTPEAL